MSARAPERLAIDGGDPVRPRLLPYGRQIVDDDDVASVVEVLRSDLLTTGPVVDRFEAAFAELVGARHAVAVSSGTAALHVAAAATGLGPGDEVIVPPLTFVATANCVRYVGGTVVFADVRADTLTIDPAAVAAAANDRTKAIIAVDYAGQPCDMTDLRSLARRRGLWLLEDAAHSLGGELQGRPVGGLADVTIFSLHPVKHITAGEGGVVVTDDPRIAERSRRFRNHGITASAREREAGRTWLYDVPELGYNYRLTDIQSALALSQLRKFDGRLARRRSIADMYSRALADVPAIELPTVLPDRRSAWHIYVIRLRRDRLSVDRAQVFRALRAENIGVNVHYIPIPRLGQYRDHGARGGSWPVADDAYERMITLPLWPGMSDDDVADVVRAVMKVCEAYAV